MARLDGLGQAGHGVDGGEDDGHEDRVDRAVVARSGISRSGQQRREDEKGFVLADRERLDGFHVVEDDL